MLFPSNAGQAYKSCSTTISHWSSNVIKQLLKPLETLQVFHLAQCNKAPT